MSTTFTNNFALVAAHGITSRTAATWHPKLPRTPRVMVPVQVEALPVRSEGGVWADCTFKTPPRDAADTSRLDLLPEPFANLSEARPRGVYLHWALPDGLTRGTATKDQSNVSFGAAPDRWLVLRLSPSTNGTARRAVRGWVLRAGDEQATHVDLDSWIETGTTEGDVHQPLTALGHGDPAWAAYYDNVTDRFAFYDDLKDVASGPLAYLVCGWYADPSLDPLGSEIHSLADFHARMNELGWELAQGELHESVTKASDFLKAAAMIGLPTLEASRVETKSTTTVGPVASLSSTVRAVPVVSGAGSTPGPLDDAGHPVEGFYTTNGAWWPKQTIYHGAVVGIGWPGIGFPGSEDGLLSGEVGGPPRASDVKVVVGNTLTEALGAVVAQTNNAPQQARLLEAFMLGALNELDQADGPARVDVRLHASAFGSVPGGETTEQIFQPPMGAASPLPADPGKPDPGIFKRKARAKTNFEVFQRTTPGPVTVETKAFHPSERFTESNVKAGRLDSAIAGLKQRIVPTPEPGKYITVKRSLPRFFHPGDPVFLLQGAKRSYKHGHDGRFSADGRPICRLTGCAITELSCSAVDGRPIRPSVRGNDVLERGVENGSVPPECEELLREAVLLDPGTAVTAAKASRSVSSRDEAAQSQNFMVEQTVWWATRDPRVDHAPLVTHSGLAGMLPSPIAVTPPIGPWTPLHLDWQIQFIPSPNGVTDWSLDEIDYQPRAGVLPAADDTSSGIILKGRALLTGGAAATIAAGVRKALEQAQSAGGAAAIPPGTVPRYHSPLARTLLSDITTLTVEVNSALAGVNGEGGVPAVDRSALADIASTLEHMDVLAGALDNFHTRLRGGVIGDGTSTAPGGTPTPFVPMRAGFLRVLRLRLVDCFGQAVDLAGSGESAIADPRQLVKTEPVRVGSREDIAALSPRFTSPARMWFRFLDASGQDREATPDISPVCGYLLPNHLDGELDFYDANGDNLGGVRPEPGAGVVWSDAPGRASTVGQQPSRAMSNQFLAGVAQGLIDWGIADASLGEGRREDALSALLRIVDSTLWSVDPFGHVGDEHLSLLIGHPVAVMRALVRLEVSEPVDAATINVMKVALRLGALTHWQDGLLGYFVNDDYRTLYCADGAVARFAREVGPRRGFLQPVNLVPNFYQNFSNDIGVSVTEGSSPVNHPYVDDSGLLEIVPNQKVLLTLLMEPHSVVHATVGLVPRKEIGMRREWVAAALSRIAPTFRFGPVLLDPKRIRMPVATDLHGSWSWDHRSDITTWAEEKVINTTGDALLQPDPAKGQEGWLKLTFEEQP